MAAMQTARRTLRLAFHPLRKAQQLQPQQERFGQSVRLKVSTPSRAYCARRRAARRVAWRGRQRSGQRSGQAATRCDAQPAAALPAAQPAASLAAALPAALPQQHICTAYMHLVHYTDGVCTAKETLCTGRSTHLPGPHARQVASETRPWTWTALAAMQTARRTLTFHPVREAEQLQPQKERFSQSVRL